MMHSTPYSNCSTPRNKAPLCCAQPWILLESTRGHALAQGSAISKVPTCQRKVLGDLSCDARAAIAMLCKWPGLAELCLRAAR